MNPNPALGLNADFDADGFRNAINFAMEMGFNPDPTRRPVFIKKSTTRTYEKNGLPILNPRLDRDGNPLDPEIDVIETPDEEISVDCAIEVEILGNADELPVGNFKPTRITATLLDHQYALVKDCREMIYNGDKCIYGFEPMSVGLFDVAVHQMIFYVLDDA